jgi:RND family efflux transporter MFP subunit
MKTRLITGITLMMLFCACSGNRGKETKESDGEVSEVKEDKPALVKVKQLEYADFSYELISNGTIAAMQKADLKFQSQEIIRKIHVRNGQSVVKGQKIAELDKFKLETALKQAWDALERARLDLQDVLIGLGYSLADSAEIPADMMKVAKIRSNHEQSQTSYEIARHNLDAATLYAPFDGIIANLTAKEFNLPDGESFCTIIDNRSPEAVFNILENELPLTNLNDKALVSPFSQPDYTAEGRITEINPMIDKNGMVRMKAALDNRDRRFYEGMNVKIRVQRLLGNRLVIPKSALVLRAGRKVVFVLNSDRASWVYVETAQENSDSYVIADGLKAGDAIICEGNINLAHNARVIVEN